MFGPKKVPRRSARGAGASSSLGDLGASEDAEGQSTHDVGNHSLTSGRNKMPVKYARGAGSSGESLKFARGAGASSASASEDSEGQSAPDVGNHSDECSHWYKIWKDR